MTRIVRRRTKIHMGMCEHGCCDGCPQGCFETTPDEDLFKEYLMSKNKITETPVPDVQTLEQFHCPNENGQPNLHFVNRDRESGVYYCTCQCVFTWESPANWKVIKQGDTLPAALTGQKNA